jgi:hypothetical protein
MNINKMDKMLFMCLQEKENKSTVKEANRQEYAAHIQTF